MTDVIAKLQRQISDQSKRIAQLELVIKNMFRHMTVTEFDAEKDRFEAKEEIDGDDGETESPPIRMLSQSGKVKRRTTVSAEEQVLVICPTGYLDESAFGLPFGPNEKNQSPSNEAVEDYAAIGGNIRILNGAGHILTGAVNLGAKGGKPVARKGDKVRLEDGTIGEIIEGSGRVFAAD